MAGLLLLTLENFLLMLFLVFSVSFVFGYTFSKIMFRTFIKREENGGKIFDNAVELFFVYISCGFISMIFVGFLLSLVNFFNSNGVIIILIFVSCICVISIIFNKGNAHISFIGSLKTVFKEAKSEIFFIILLLMGLSRFFYPAVYHRIAAYPGGDDIGYVFISKQFVDKGSVLTGISYPYSKSFMYHILFAGFMVIVVFYYNLFHALGFHVSISLLHLFLTLLYFSLAPTSLYLFTKKVTQRSDFSTVVGISSLFMWESILFYFYWGGEAEALGYYLIPIFGLIDYELSRRLMYSLEPRKTILTQFFIKMLLFCLILYVHIYSAILFLFLTSIANPLCLYVRFRDSSIKDQLSSRQLLLKIYLKTVFPYHLFILAVLIAYFSILTFFKVTGINNEVIEILYNVLLNVSAKALLNDKTQNRFTPQWLILRKGYGLNYVYVKFFQIFTNFYGSWVIYFIGLYLLCAFYLHLEKGKGIRRELGSVMSFSNMMLIAGFMFFLFSQNNPFGWYYIPYPLAKRILAVRLYYEMNVFVIYLESLPIYFSYKLLTNLASKIVQKKVLFAFIRKRTRYFLKEITGFLLIFLVIYTLLSSVNEIQSNYERYCLCAQRETVVTINDIAAFDWILRHTSEEDIFLVNAADAGPYIYIYVGRIVWPPHVLKAWPSDLKIMEDYEVIFSALITGNISMKVYSLIKKYNITYVYVGERTHYGLPKYNVSALIDSPLFKLAFNRGQVYIFEVGLVNDTL